MSDGPSARFGIAEWFGRRVQALTEEERRRFAQEARKNNPSLPCIPRSQEDDVQECTKEGGVCSIRLYDREGNGGEALPTAEPEDGPVVTLCPHRFKEQSKIYQWVGDIVLDDRKPEFVTEVPFLERDRHPGYSDIWGASLEEDDSEDDVGRIDGILISAAVEKIEPENRKGEDEEDEASQKVSGTELSLANRLEQDYALNLSVELEDWCGLEIQSVYFSGDRMSLEYDPFTEVPPPKAPFPEGRRRPDFRSSSAKRLLPQLQTKIPSLRRWGKKMAVVVDEAFFYEMAEMEAVDHISNCDIVWVVVGYEREGGALRLRRRKVHFTTLEDAVLGLTAGKPVAREQFEDRVLRKLKAPYVEEYIETLNEWLDRLMLRRKKGLQVSIRWYIDRMKKIRSNRAQQNRRLESTDDDQEKDRLRRSIEAQDRQLESLWERRETVENKEERLKERCKAIRSVRARLNEEID
jgi:hypothetical protein